MSDKIDDRSNMLKRLILNIGSETLRQNRRSLLRNPQLCGSETERPRDISVIKNVKKLLAAEGKFASAVWSLGDQALVSAANFLVLLFLARYSTSADVGIYAIVFSIVVIFISVQEALISRPYTVSFFDSELTGRQLAGGALLLTLFFSGFACLVSITLLLVYSFNSEEAQLSPLIAAFSFALPFALLRQFIRRYLLSTVSVRELFFFDAVCITLFLCSIFYVSKTHEFDVVTVVFIMGGSYSMCSLVWLLLRIKQFKLRIIFAKKAGLVFWEIGKWLLPTRAIRELQGYMTHWFSIVLMSASATGVFAANLSVVALSNPFVLGLLNIMTPGAVRTYKDDGMVGLRDQTITNMFIMSMIMIIFFSFIYVFGEAIINLLFPAKDYQQNNLLLLILTGAISIGSIASPISVSLVCAGHAKEESQIYFFVCIVSVITVPILITYAGLTGAALSILLIETFTGLARLRLLNTVFRNADVAFNFKIVMEQFRLRNR
ncbi:MAG: hypothetical protein JJ858_18800 [Rhizobiaceae bacterium]|nr:hypothetical protein [Rhizobiaceae bacterium]